MEEIVRRLGIILHINPYLLWREQSPRQVLELLESYKDMNKDLEKDGQAKNYTVKGKKRPKIPDWYTVPDGATVYHADEIFQGDI